MRLLRYGAAGLCAIAHCAFSTPSRVPEPPAPPVIEAQRGAAPIVAEHEIGDERGLRDRLVAVFPLDAAPLHGAVRQSGDTRVAEPSTLLLVSFGLFGLIAWSRRRR
jgi:hypothetical protein